MTKFIFADGEYEFWIIKFLTGRPEMIIRVPEGQAPMVRFEAIKRDRWLAYQNGATREQLNLDVLQDPWESCRRVAWENAKDMAQATRWLQACLKAGNALGYQEKLIIETISVTGGVESRIEKFWPEQQKSLDF